MTTSELIHWMTGIKIELMQLAYEMSNSSDEDIQQQSMEVLNMSSIISKRIEHLTHKEIT